MLVREVALELEARLPLEDEPAAFLDEDGEVDVGQRRFGPVGQAEPAVTQVRSSMHS